MAESNGRGGFNADERAQKRESGPITIGGVTYHPRRLTNARLRQVRRLARDAGRLVKDAAKESPEYQEAYQEAIDDGKEEKDAREIAEIAGMTAEAVGDINMESMKEQLSLLLVDDAMQPVPADAVQRHLEEDLDAREVDGLMTYLLGAEDPTPEEATT